MKMSAIAGAALVAAISPAARAETLDVTAPEAMVHTAPFDVAPALTRVHAGDKLDSEPGPSGWLRVTLPDGRHGFLHARDAEPKPPPPVAAVAPADRVVPAAMAAPPASEQGRFLLGVAFELFPAGTLSSKLQASSGDQDAELTAGVAPFFDAPITRWLALGVSPQVVFNVKAPGATQSWTEYDLRARVTVLDPISSSSRLYARVSPGYSILSPPSGALPSQVSDPTGLVVDVAVGAQTPLGPHGLMEIDIGYQLGFQGTTIDDQDVDNRTRFLHIGFGIALGL